MYVCMYVCTYVFINGYTYFQTYLYMYVCMYYVSLYVCMYVCTETSLYCLPLKQVCLTEETPPTKPYTATKFIHTPVPPTNTTTSTTNSTTTTTTPVAGNRGAAVAVPVAKNLFPAESLLVHITDTQVTALLLYVCMYLCMYVLYVCSIMYMYV